MKRPAKKRFGILGCLSFLVLMTLIVLAFVFLLAPGRWAFTRKLVRLVTGPDIRRVTIPEGWNRYQVAMKLQADGIVRAEDFLVLTEEPTILKSLGVEAATAEGYLFPDTYQFYAGGSPLTILKAMTSNFKKKYGELTKKFPSGLDAYEELSDDPSQAALIMASIVEGEVVEKTEAPIVAGIFLKRLTDTSFKPHLLQSDPTVAYGCYAMDPPPPSCEKFDGKLLRSHLNDAQNFYNTYVYAGFPPGPICNPGLSALKAALSPNMKTRYFYFVARGDGTHQFSVTLEDHKKAVSRYRRKAEQAKEPEEKDQPKEPEEKEEPEPAESPDKPAG
ncbi:MAG: endolytic transglycosylase MltG [Pseudomonadota bacterium]